MYVSEAVRRPKLRANRSVHERTERKTDRQTDWLFEAQYKQRCPLSWSSNDQMTQTFEMRDR